MRKCMHVAFLTTVRVPESVAADSSLLFLSLKGRLYNQLALRVYLDNGQVLSWNNEPFGTAG